MQHQYQMYHIPLVKNTVSLKENQHATGTGRYFYR